MKVGVVGAKGFIGAFLAEDLEREGCEILPILRGEPLPEAQLDLVLDCNGSSKRFLANQDPVASLEASVAPVVRHLAGLRFSRYVYLSTIDVYGERRSDRRLSREDQPLPLEGLEVYGFHKYLAEQAVTHHCANHGKDSLVLRVGTVIGPGLRKNPVFDAVEGFPIRMKPETTLSLIHLPTLALALRKLLAANAKGVVNVTSRESIRVSEVLSETARAVGKDPASFEFAPELGETQYDINVEKLSRWLEPPTSLEELRGFLKGKS